jgi:hypothetical protein
LSAEQVLAFESYAEIAARIEGKIANRPYKKLKPERSRFMCVYVYSEQ